RRDAGLELDYAAELINRVVDGIDGIRTGIHVCRGNWSRNDEVLLSGDYKPLIPSFKRMNVRQFVLEYATPRAGGIDVVGRELAHREIGLGVVNPRTAEVETVEYIIGRVEEALEFYPPDAIFLNPDCGFCCFANRCINDEETAVKKMRQIVSAARVLRKRYE
ncbi:MAG: vitamin-B12 independent methionine synthase, partial [Nitrospirae bacterium]|nr:vitamin-B12 independent methionine synthase [Nitrospirota bacterium]